VRAAAANWRAKRRATMGWPGCKHDHLCRQATHWAKPDGEQVLAIEHTPTQTDAIWRCLPERDQRAQQAAQAAPHPHPDLATGWYTGDGERHSPQLPRPAHPHRLPQPARPAPRELPSAPP
jgi:hypothetical protein